ncbi:hypothetical protein BDR26DRAFT_625225 [Obelidium mucronatum]|nr:hypothetical protein BDR26DRAFT_625225 [Obelidium mucronatum]
MSRSADLATMQLKTTDPTDSASLRRQFLKLSLTAHPDKPGGSTESFQALSAAFDRLTTNSYPPEASQFYDDFSCFNQDAAYSFDEFDYDHFNQFFSAYSNPTEDAFERYYKTPQQRRQDKKIGLDYRDLITGSNTCHTCASRDGLTKELADQHGVDWKQYSSHPNRRRTCWGCKGAHTSVATIKQVLAKKQFKHIGLEVFAHLKKQKKFFSHKPHVPGNRIVYTKRHDYYWIADLPVAAIAAPPPHTPPKTHRKRIARNIVDFSEDEGDYKKVLVVPPTPTKTPLKRVKSEPIAPVERNLNFKRESSEVKSEYGAMSSQVKHEIAQVPEVKEEPFSTPSRRAVSRRNRTQPVLIDLTDSAPSSPTHVRPSFKTEYNWEQEGFDLASSDDE